MGSILEMGLFGLHVGILPGELFHDYSKINASMKRAQRNGKKFGSRPTFQRD